MHVELAYLNIIGEWTIVPHCNCTSITTGTWGLGDTQNLTVLFLPTSCESVIISKKKKWADHQVHIGSSSCPWEINQKDRFKSPVSKRENWAGEMAQ